MKSHWFKLGGLLALALVLSLIASMLPTGSAIAFIPGDADGDGDVDVFDLVKVKRIILEIDAPTPGGDADLDSDVDVFDLVKVKRIILGIPPEFEVVDIDQPSEIEPCQDLVVSVDVRNAGAKAGDSFVEVWVEDGEGGIVVAPQTLKVPTTDPGSTFTVEDINLGHVDDTWPDEVFVVAHSDYEGQDLYYCSITVVKCPPGGWNVDYQAYGQMLLYTSIGGAPLGDPIPSPATCNWTMNYGCAELQGSLFRVLSVPQLSWYFFPFCAPVSSGPPLNWVTIDVTMDADGSGQLFTAGPGIDVDVFSDTCDTVNAMWDCTGHANATGKCLCGLCSPCDGTTTLADCVVGNCVVTGDGATSATEIAGSALLYLPLTAHVYSAMTGPTDPYDPTTWGSEALAVPLNFTFTTEMAYATMHDSNLDGFPGIALDGITLPAGPGMPFIALGGFAPYVATAGVMVAASGLVDGVALGVIELDALFNMMLSLAPWTLTPTITPAIPVLGDTIDVAVLVHRIGGPPGQVPVEGYIMDLYDGSIPANLGLQMTGVLDVCDSETLTWASCLTPANAGIYMLSAGATTIMVLNPVGLTPSFGSALYMGTVGVPMDIDVSVNNPGAATEDFTISLSIKDATPLEVHTDRATVTVLGSSSSTHNFSWTPTATGMYTVDVVDPVDGSVLASANAFVM